MGGCITAMASRDLAAGVQRAKSAMGVTHGVVHSVVVSKSSKTRTVRLQNDLWALIAADAEARGENVNAVIARHLRIAYAPKDKLTVQRIVDETMASPMGARATAKVNTQRPPSIFETAPAAGKTTVNMSTTVPVLTRPAFNPQPKKGKK